jgi:polyhydroxybutyrate depolymerase
MARTVATLGTLAGCALLLACASGGPRAPSIPDGVDAQLAPPTPDARAPAPTEPDAPPAPQPDARAGGPEVAPVDPAPTADGAAPTDLPPASGEPGAGCAVPAGLPEGQATIVVGAANRTYILRLPGGYTNTRAWPLILALHPNGGSGIGYWDGAGGARSIRALAKDKAIVVLPLALPAGGGFDWRGHLPADLAFFDGLMARLQSRLCIDSKRIFAMGFSGGGSFSGVLACRRSDIRAFASGSGVEYYDPKDCVASRAAWITVGADELIAARTAFRDDWVMRNKCQPMTSPTPPANCLAYACPKEGPVHFCVHPGGHLWPDYGTDAAWTFFSQF